MGKTITTGVQSRKSLLTGVNKLERTVRVTLGPTACNIMLEQKFRTPLVCSDGVTVVKAIDVADPTENFAVRLLREAASRTNDAVGDGTTTSVVLAAAMVREGYKYIAFGAQPQGLKQGIEKASRVVRDQVQLSAIPIRKQEQIEQVATLSAHDPSIGSMIASAFERIGQNGVISIEDSSGMLDELRVVEGMSYDRGFISSVFATDQERQIALLEDPYILLHDGEISNMNDLLPMLEKVVQSGKKNFLVIADGVVGSALHLLVVNKQNGLLNIVVARAPAYGDRRKSAMKDIAVLIGATVISRETGTYLKDTTLEQLGRAGRVRVSQNETIIAEGAGTQEAIAARTRELEAQLHNPKTGEFDRELLKEQIGKLHGGIALIKVGATSDVELQERKERFEDALASTKASLEGGIVPGGGVALLRTLPSLQELFKQSSGDEKYGVQIVMRAIEEPLMAIVQNTGEEAPAVVEKVKAATGDYGYDAEGGEFTTLLDRGIIDAAKVVQSSLENAASVAALLLTTEGTIAFKQEGKKK